MSLTLDDIKNIKIDVNLKFKLNGKEYDLKETEARELMGKLKDIFGDNNYNYTPYIQYPSQPYPFQTWCSNGTETKLEGSL